LSGEILHAERKIVKQRPKIILQGFYTPATTRLLDRSKMQVTNRNRKGE
jgi:hypothetical protein